MYKIKILGVSDNHVIRGLVSSLSLISDLEQVFLPSTSFQNKKEYFNDFTLLLFEEQINLLPRFRLHFFHGSVLVLSRKPSYALKEQYRILRWGQNSHDASPLILSTLFQKLLALEPLARENLRLLKTELKAAPNVTLKKKIIPILNRLSKSQSSQDLENLSALIVELRSKTPAACHISIEIADQQAQIQEHFRCLIDEIRSGPIVTLDQVSRLRATFEKWRDLVLETGEGLGALEGW